MAKTPILKATRVYDTSRERGCFSTAMGLDPFLKLYRLRKSELIEMVVRLAASSTDECDDPTWGSSASVGRIRHIAARGFYLADRKGKEHTCQIPSRSR